MGGANTRLVKSPAFRELAYAAKAILLMSLNSGNTKNIA
jgi:hypothetical protein